MKNLNVWKSLIEEHYDGDIDREEVDAIIDQIGRIFVVRDEIPECTIMRIDEIMVNQIGNTKYVAGKLFTPSEGQSAAVDAVHHLSGVLTDQSPDDVRALMMMAVINQALAGDHITVVSENLWIGGELMEGIEFACTKAVIPTKTVKRDITVTMKDGFPMAVENAGDQVIIVATGSIRFITMMDWLARDTNQSTFIYEPTRTTPRDVARLKGKAASQWGSQYTKDRLVVYGSKTDGGNLISELMTYPVLRVSGDTPVHGTIVGSAPAMGPAASS